jgi:hypothetical protein
MDGFAHFDNELDFAMLDFRNKPFYLLLDTFKMFEQPGEGHAPTTCHFVVVAQISFESSCGA